MKGLINRVEREISNLRGQNYSCSQATFLGICSVFNSQLTIKQQLSISSGFRGGIGRSYNEGTCGALSAGVMALGCCLPQENEKAIALSKELFDYFKKEYDTVICGNIVQKYYYSRCTCCCTCVGTKVAELLAREKCKTCIDNDDK